MWAGVLFVEPQTGLNDDLNGVERPVAFDILETGETPHENAQFLLFLAVVIQAVDDYQDLLRISVASAGNDHRLGANEAPPAIVSIFLGTELTEILEALESGADYHRRAAGPMEIGVTVLPHFPKDTTDRNRTSPFAFTGNKFEFRMLGSAFSIAGPNIMLNTAVAESLRQFADVLEQSSDFAGDLAKLIQSTLRAHKRIIFNGNNYTDEWVSEAARRGLLNLTTTVDARPRFLDDKNIRLFTTHGVYTEAEMRSRYEIQMESYCKTLHIEALAMVDLVKREIIPAGIACQTDLAQLLAQKTAYGYGFDVSLEKHLLERISALDTCLLKQLSAPEDALLSAKEDAEILTRAVFYRDSISPAMSELRLAVDTLETFTAKKYWPLPSYAELLNSVV